MTILLAGLMGIPKDYYEAARIDGVNFRNKLRFITVPLMMPTITITVVLNIIYALKVFDIIVILTGGGPVDATAVMYSKVWDQMSLGLYGVATALSSVLFVIMAFIGYFIIKLMNRGDVEL